VIVAEKGRLGVLVGKGVIDGVTSESGVAEGGNVWVGISVAVSVRLAIVGVHEG
jgi:hypothetical protein